ncbi:hypothetical protein [Streptomyces phage phiSAJS1]|uniref:hypothetical protein n=1 Tax=Streptomyces phage phiSAJS1 TaxID=1755682 RepID=UPI000E30351F|nr:hypothetical protein AVT91_p18 [Streptomyces phage phiSAJS1]AXP07817.1 hypothetical protein [Streptomyces phage phiSAJS1]
MACGCNKGRAAVTADGTPVPAGTYRVMVADRQVYESSSKEAADMVASSFTNATVLAPGQ